VLTAVVAAAQPAVSTAIVPTAVAALAVAVAAPSDARAEEPRSADGIGVAPLAPVAGDEEPKRYPPSSVRWKLILGGAGLTGVAYAATLGSSLIWPHQAGITAMRVPIAGPWIALGQNACPKSDPECGAMLYVRGALFVISGIVQASGLGLVGEGIFMTTEAEGPKAKAARPIVVPMPIITGSTAGFGVVGTF
jgi:hypothetical protein